MGNSAHDLTHDYQWMDAEWRGMSFLLSLGEAEASAWNVGSIGTGDEAAAIQFNSQFEIPNSQFEMSFVRRERSAADTRMRQFEI